MVKEAGADIVKLEGSERRLSRVRAIIDAGIPVMGHIGLTPQSATKLGGYRAQGRTAVSGQRSVRLREGDRGCRRSALVVEAVPRRRRRAITAALEFRSSASARARPVTGRCSCGTTCSACATIACRASCKRYAHLSEDIARALEAYASDVRAGAYPEAEAHLSDVG